MGNVKIGEVYKKKLLIESNSPVSFEYQIEWVKDHPDISITPLSGDIVGGQNVKLELVYRPCDSTTAQAVFTIITTEFDSKPQEVKIIGSAIKARIAVGPIAEEEREEDDYESKTLLKHK